jgi:DUF2934 family protein
MSTTPAGRNVSIQVSKRSRSDNVPHRDDIAVRAYELYKKRGAGHGHDQEDWYEAELQLIRERETYRA